MKYVVVRDYLVELVGAGLSPGDAIPSERELAERFSVSRMTVRQAVDALVVDGLLERRQGSGTYVARPKVDVQSRINSFSEEMRQRGMIPGTRVLRAEELPAAAEVAMWLGIAPHQRVHFLHRVRLADGVPMSVEKTWVPVDLVPDLLAQGPPRSMYEALAEAGLAPTWGEDTIEAVAADAGQADLLGATPGAPLLDIGRRTYAGDTAVSYSRSLFRGDRYKLWVPISGPRRAVRPPRRDQGGTR